MATFLDRGSPMPNCSPRAPALVYPHHPGLTRGQLTGPLLPAHRSLPGQQAAWFSVQGTRTGSMPVMCTGSLVLGGRCMKT